MEQKEKIYGFLNSDIYSPMKPEEIATVLSVPKEDRELFYSLVDELIKEGRVVLSKRGKLTSCEKMGYITGVYTSTSRGFGFVIREGKEDIFISKNANYGAMHGDSVVARITNEASGERRCEGEIVRVADRANKKVVGVLRRKNKNFYVVPDNEKLWYYIDISKAGLKGAEKGQKVVVKITKYPTDKESPKGVIEEVLGWPDSNDVKLLSVMYSYGLEPKFPEKVMKESENIPQEISELSLEGRRDMRGKQIITIDGEDAKDLDDAVSVEFLDNGNYLLSVHIADVSEYVKEGSAIDKEALNRGTSVYLPGTVVPMLPPRLSNGICSLNRASDRLTLSVDMEMDKYGNMVNYDIYTAVISTEERMTYTAVKKIINGDKDTCSEYKNIVPLIERMNSLARLLRAKRLKEGYIDFNFSETQLVFDDEMKVTEVKCREITEANELIEEFMLAANNCIAEHFFWVNIPFVYRIHEKPDSEKIESLAALLGIFGLKIKGKKEEIHPKTLAGILEQVKDEPYALVVGQTMLRSMKKARYSTECLGHFGLSAKYYCHFTSPIRRYPDLIIHRIIKEYLKQGGFTESREGQLVKATEEAALQSSKTEINAQEAERTAIKIKVAEFMKDYVGERFTGCISSVTGFGFFVQLPNLVEGLVRISDITDDYYEYVQAGMFLRGERNGKEFHIGQQVDIVVARADDLSGEIDFILV